jgi:phage shock protein E
MRRYTIALLLFSVLMALTVVAYLYWYALDSPFRTTPEVARILLGQKKIDYVLDVRTPLEREKLGFYPGSLHIQAADLETKIGNQIVNPAAVILVYCNTGQRARMAVEKLHALGYRGAFYITTVHDALM